MLWVGLKMRFRFLAFCSPTFFVRTISSRLRCVRFMLLKPYSTPAQRPFRTHSFLCSSTTLHWSFFFPPRYLVAFQLEHLVITSPVFFYLNALKDNFLFNNKMINLHFSIWMLIWSHCWVDCFDAREKQSWGIRQHLRVELVLPKTKFSSLSSGFVEIRFLRAAQTPKYLSHSLFWMKQ